jgi:exodeoxyribonuclease III
MRVISFNANGIRSAASKGFFEWLPRQQADVVCIQETKAQREQLDGNPVFFPEGWHCFYEDATAKKGYAGVALYSRREPDKIRRGLGVEEFDGEGRFIEACFGQLSVISLYLPSGSSGPHRQASKDRFLEFFMPQLKKWAKSNRDYIICGDWNIAHKPIDLKNWKSNQKNSGFLPHERAWMDALLNDAGWVDAYRMLHPETTDECYTWWSNRGQARAKNVGWRIDYHVVTPSLKDRISQSGIYKETWFSDHAPLILDYQYDF